MAENETIKVKVSHRYPASQEKVFDAFLDPKKAGKFMFATSVGKMIKVELDPKVGGRFLFIERRPTGDAEHYGKFIEIERPRHLKFDFWVDKKATVGDPVTVEVMAVKNGCQVTLTHEMSAEYADYEDKVADGWTGILEKLFDAL